MGFRKNCILFLLGGSAYVTLEFLWRRRSHGSMFFLGGACFLLIGKLSRKVRHWHLLAQAALYAGVITVLELFAGLLVNRQYRVWDYRGVRGNFKGQICLPYFLLWMPVGLLARGLYAVAEKALEHKS